MHIFYISSIKTVESMLVLLMYFNKIHNALSFTRRTNQPKNWTAPSGNVSSGICKGPGQRARLHSLIRIFTVR